MSRFFTSLKRNKNHVQLYYDGKLIATLKVSEHNRGVQASIDFDADDKLRFKIIKEDDISSLIDESYFNKEQFNK